MEITGNKVSQYLENIDRFMDRWGLSPINNLVNCVTKICMRIYRCYYADEGKFKAEREKAFLGHYFNYIDKKDGEMCVVGLVPLLGSVLICDYNKTCENNKKRNQDMALDLSRTSPPHSEEEVGDGSDLSVDYEDNESADGSLDGDSLDVILGSADTSNNFERLGIFTAHSSPEQTDNIVYDYGIEISAEAPEVSQVKEKVGDLVLSSQREDITDLRMDDDEAFMGIDQEP